MIKDIAASGNARILSFIQALNIDRILDSEQYSQDIL